MGWLGPWIGGGAGGSPAEPSRPVRRGGSPEDRTLAALQAAFSGEGDPKIYLGTSAVAGDAITVSKVASAILPETGQTLRAAIQAIVQSETEGVMQALHSRLVDALLSAETLSVITHEVGPDVFEDKVGDYGVYRRPTTFEVRG